MTKYYYPRFFFMASFSRRKENKKKIEILIRLKSTQQIQHYCDCEQFQLPFGQKKIN